MKRHSAPRILCSDQRDYTSSGLIKYVPNKSRKITQDLTSQPLDVTRLDHSELGSQVKGNCKEARDGTFLDLQEKNDTGSYMNVSCDDSDEGIMSLDKGINASRWDHSVLGSQVKEETGEGTVLHLRVKNDAEMYSDASCDDSNEGICFMQARSKLKFSLI